MSGLIELAAYSHGAGLRRVGAVNRGRAWSAAAVVTQASMRPTERPAQALRLHLEQHPVTPTHSLVSASMAAHTSSPAGPGRHVSISRTYILLLVFTRQS